jgi:glucoamylase
VFDPWVMVSRAAAFMILQGSVTGQDRWEENAGYSPSTVIAGLVCAAEFAKGRGETYTSEFISASCRCRKSHRGMVSRRMDQHHPIWNRGGERSQPMVL